MARSKDLLLVLSPFFWLSLGCYSNKVGTEGRAESAEATQRTPSAEVQGGASAARADTLEQHCAPKLSVGRAWR